MPVCGISWENADDVIDPAQKGDGSGAMSASMSMTGLDRFTMKGDAVGSIDEASWEFIHPHSTFRRNWDRIVLACIMYNAFILMFRFSFKVEFELNLFLIVEYLMDLFFVIDVLLNFRTGFTHAGSVVRDRDRIFAHYVNNWFTVDFISAFPFDVIALVVGGFRVVALLRLPKIIRVTRFFNYFRIWENDINLNSNFVRLVKMFLGIFLISHWMGCLWYYIHEFADKTWFEAPGKPLSETYLFYIQSFYWVITTMTGVGYGDVTPTTTLETYFCITVQLLGITMFGYVVGSLTTLISNQQHTVAANKAKMVAINRYMAYRDLPSNIRERVLNYFRYEFSRNQGMDENEILGDLPHTLRGEVNMFLRRKMIENVDLFHGCSNTFIRTLVMVLQPQIYAHGDYVVRRGEMGNEMFFLYNGVVQVVNDQGQVTEELHEGDFFGEVALLMSSRRTASVRAKGICEVCKLTREDLYKVLEENPSFLQRMKDVARRRYLNTLDLPDDGMTLGNGLGSRGKKQHMDSKGFLRNMGNQLRRGLLNTGNSPAKSVGGGTPTSQASTGTTPNSANAADAGGSHDDDSATSPQLARLRASGGRRRSMSLSMAGAAQLLARANRAKNSVKAKVRGTTSNTSNPNNNSKEEEQEEQEPEDTTATNKGDPTPTVDEVKDTWAPRPGLAEKMKAREAEREAQKKRGPELEERVRVVRHVQELDAHIEHSTSEEGKMQRRQEEEKQADLHAVLEEEEGKEREEQERLRRRQLAMGLLRSEEQEEKQGDGDENVYAYDSSDYSSEEEDEQEPRQEAHRTQRQQPRRGPQIGRRAPVGRHTHGSDSESDGEGQRRSTGPMRRRVAGGGGRNAGTGGTQRPPQVRRMR